MASAHAHEARIPFWVWVALPVVVAMWLRLRGVGEPEPFVDEGANILTALDPRVRESFEPLGQGRPWLVHLFKPAGWFPASALDIARIMSGCAGLATLGALGVTLHRLADRRTAVWGLWLWAVLPIAVFHERLALQDPFVTALLAWALAFITIGSFGTGNRTRWPWFVFAGVLFGAAFLLKISAAFALPWLGLLFAQIQWQAKRPIINRSLSWFALGAIVPLLSLGSELWQLGSKLHRYGALPSLDGSGADINLMGRLTPWLKWYIGYGGWPLIVLTVGAVFAAGYLRHRSAIACAVGWLISVVVSAGLYNNVYARYLLPDHLPLILFVALAWSKLAAASPRLGMTALAFSVLAFGRWGFVSWQLGTDPTRAAVPASDIAQYFTGPWSGRGLSEVRSYLTKRADRDNVRCLVLTHRFLRPGCYGLLLAELADARIGVVPLTIYAPETLTAAVPRLRHATAGQPVMFFILYEGSLYPAHPWLDAIDSPARRVLEVKRGAGETFTLYQFDLPPAESPATVRASP
jgi:hypothetical protein